MFKRFRSPRVKLKAISTEKLQLFISNTSWTLRNLNIPSSIVKASWRTNFWSAEIHQVSRGLNFYCINGDSAYPANIYFFKVNNKNTRKRYKICSTLTIKTPERRQWRQYFTPFSSVSILEFEQVKR